MEKTEEMQDLFKRRVSEKAQKIILENDRSVLREIFQYMEYEYYKEDLKNQRDVSGGDELTEKSVREIAEKFAYDGEEDSNLNYYDNIDLMIDKYGVSAKYELTDETMEFNGHTLHRIRALKDFGDVKEGDLGGFIESEDNLSHEGDCWVYGDAVVCDKARVYGDAWVFGNALVYENAQVYEDAKVYDCACIYGNSKVYENARVYENTDVFGFAEVYGEAQVFGGANVYENAKVEGKAEVYGDAIVEGKAEISKGEISSGKIDGSEKKNIELD